MKHFCLFFFIFRVRWFQGSCLPSVLLCPLFWVTEQALSNDQSTACKGQGCVSSIPLHILPPSMNLILTRKDNTNSITQIWAHVSKQAYPSVRKQFDFFFFLTFFYFFFFMYRLRPKHLKHIQNPLSVSWRTRLRTSWSPERWFIFFFCAQDNFLLPTIFMRAVSLWSIFLTPCTHWFLSL